MDTTMGSTVIFDGTEYKIVLRHKKTGNSPLILVLQDNQGKRIEILESVLFADQPVVKPVSKVKESLQPKIIIKQKKSTK